MPKMFMYGQQNAALSYLSHIESRGVRLSEIPECGHFPMYSNPTLMWRAISEFQSVQAKHRVVARDAEPARDLCRRDDGLARDDA